MNRLLFCLVSALLFTSCATILNDKTYVVKIQSNEPNAKVKVQDSIYTLPVYTEIERSKGDLVFTLLKEPKNIEFRVKPKLSGKLLLNIPMLATIIPGIIATAIDLDNYKKFHYGKSFYLNTKDSTVTASKPVWISYGDYVPKKYRRNKGDFYLHISLPYYNFFHLKPVNEPSKITDGFLGISTGVDYFHSKKQFLSLTASYITTHWLFIPIEGEDMDDTYHDEKSYSSFISLTNNHKINRFSIGYGLLYGKNTWHLEENQILTPGNPSPPYTPPTYAYRNINKSYNILGFVFPAYFQMGKTFNLGFIYRPIFYRFTSTQQFQYEHTMSIDFGWKIKL